MTLNISVTDDQLGVYFRKVAAIADRLGKSLPFDHVMVELQAIHDGKFDKISAPKPKHSVLKLLNADVFVGPLEKPFDPHVFYKTRKGLYVWDSFRERILPGEKPIGTAEETKLAGFDLARNAYDREIKAELSASHEVELWQIAALIEKQKNGEDGPLLNNGYANLFYARGFVVSVHWDGDDRKWNVNDWKPDDDGWGRGSRVFSRS